MEAIALLSSMSSEFVDGLLDHFNLKILNVMDAVAPIRTKSTWSKQKTPWRNTIMVISLKRECRKAERKWRKTKLQIHYELTKKSLRNNNNEPCKARQLHLSGMINKNVNNSRTLFAMIEKLTNPPNLSRCSLQSIISKP